MVFQKATKEKAKLRMALMGPSGCGKTYTALNLAQYLGKKVCLVDTEGGSASKYANLFDFCTLTLTDCHPSNFVKAIDAAVAEGFEVIILDSLSHAWNGKNGLLELTDREKLKITNQFQAWAKVAPIQNALVNKLLTAPIHILTTLRVKTAYEMQEENGRKKPVKIGLAPVQKEGIEYEFDVLAEMTTENTLIVSKTRCPALNGQVYPKPGKEVADVLNAWLNDGVEPAPTAAIQMPEQSPAAQVSPIKEKAALSLQTNPPKPVPAKAAQEQTADLPSTGTFEREGVLKEIKHNSGKGGKFIWGLFLEGVKDAFVTYSQAVNMQAVDLVGKTVKIKAVVNNKQAVILSIALAAN